MSILNSLFSRLGLVPHLETAAIGLWHLVLIFLTRHWLLAVANAGFTVLLGMGLLRLLPRFPHPFLTLRPTRTVPRRLTGLHGFFFQDLDLRLSRLLFVAALCKGSLYLVLGDRHHTIGHYPYGLSYGFQIPDVRELLGFIPSTPNSTLWRPTAATEQVGFALGVLALILLLRRVRQVAALLSWLEMLACVCAPSMADQGADVKAQKKNPQNNPHEKLQHSSGTLRLPHDEGLDRASNEKLETRVRSAMNRAAADMNFLPAARLPRPLLIEVMIATPLLVGLSRPHLLLAPSLVTTLSDAELDAMLRHELAHFRRQDHWWRWALLWVEDIGRLNPLSGWLSVQAMNLEENICDQWAVSSGREAAALGRAIAKAQAHFRGISQTSTNLLPPAILDGRSIAIDRVLPQLLGHTFSNQSAMVERRLQRLVEIAKMFPYEITSVTGTFPPSASARPAGDPLELHHPMRFGSSQEKLQEQNREKIHSEHRIGRQTYGAIRSFGRILSLSIRSDYALRAWRLFGRIWTMLVVALVLLVIYAKFYLVLNLR